MFGQGEEALRIPVIAVDAPQLALMLMFKSRVCACDGNGRYSSAPQFERGFYARAGPHAETVNQRRPSTRSEKSLDAGDEHRLMQRDGRDADSSPGLVTDAPQR